MKGNQEKTFLTAGVSDIIIFKESKEQHENLKRFYSNWVTNWM
jgi:hypothetical protein